MAPSSVTKLPLHQIATQHADAIVFDATSISSLGNDAAFLIFYLSKEDEFNGYGTVIQLDPQTKQAAIYSDLNPEYTYLFYANEQGQIQTLLWCIEVATQTADGLFIAHAKTYGRGISADDLKLFKQVDLPENQPQPQHSLAESYAPAATSALQPNQTNVAPLPSQPAPQMQASTAAQPTTMTGNLAQPSPPPASMASAPAQTSVVQPTDSPNQAQNQTESPLPLPNFQQALSPTPSSPSTQAPQAPQAPQPPTVEPATLQQPVFNTTPVQQAVPTGETVLPASKPEMPEVAPMPTTPPTQPLSFISEEADSEDTMTSDVMELNLPPLTTQQPPITPEGNPSSAMPADMPGAILQPVMPSPSPAQPAAQQQSAMNNQTQATPKQPVGRPPKPLLQDQLWTISPDDFIWVKNMSRQPIRDFQDVLHQKTVQQIRTNKPGLMEDWQFTGHFEQAFNSLCTTYELIPALRHDILKALLNGRVVENLRKSLGNTVPPVVSL